MFRGIFWGIMAPRQLIPRLTWGQNGNGNLIGYRVFKPHSTFSASTSKAAAKQIPLRTIMNTAGWSRQSTFTKFYKKTVLVCDDGEYANTELTV